MATDYAKMKVTELKDLLLTRKLPVTGIKAELIARLEAADSAAASATPATPETSSTPAASHLPSAEEYEVDWDENDKPAAPAAEPVAPTPAPAPAAAEEKKVEKPKRKTIASLFDTPSTTTAAAAKEPSSPSTVSDETSNKPAPAAAAPTPSFSANLPTTSLDEEIARRKKRAERFGLSAQESDALKALERQKRFGTVDEKKDVEGLDAALPERERKRRNEGVQQQGRGGKRGRFEGRQQQQRGGQKRGGPNGNGRNPGRVQKTVPVTADPEERRKAEERRKRFAAA
jgi:SAP domain-containing ribonucleoprotein